jgi:hypothetical protein
MTDTSNSANTLSTSPSAGRYFFTAMSALFLLVAIIGFGPNSVAILGGSKPSPPFIVHLHAAMMSFWLLLLLTQALLKASNNLALHMRLGLCSLVFAPLLVLVMIAVTWVRYHDMSAAGLGAIASNVLMLQIRAVLLFTIFLVWALRVRTRDGEAHKRLMLLATLVMLDAAIGRMSWLPGHAMPLSYDAIHAYLLLLFAPLLVFDLLRYRRVHRTYVIGLSLLLVCMVATSLLWSHPWWLRTASTLMGTA